MTVTRKLDTPLEHAKARQIVGDLAQWHIHALKTSDLLQAIDLQREHQLSFWDAQIILSAANLGCTFLLSEDLNHGQLYGNVQVNNPFK